MAEQELIHLLQNPEHGALLPCLGYVGPAFSDAQV